MNAHALAFGHGHMGFGHAEHWVFGVLWAVIFLLFWGSLVYAILRRGRGRHDGTGAGLAVLGERFARGEIDEDEYRQRAAVLRAKKK